MGDDALASEDWFQLKVPLTVADMPELDFVFSDRVTVFDLTRGECRAVFPTFYAFDEEFDLCINFEEADIIPAERLPRAIAIVRRDMTRTDDSVERRGLSKILDALRLAVRRGVPVEVSLGL